MFTVPGISLVGLATETIVDQTPKPDSSRTRAVSRAGPSTTTPATPLRLACMVALPPHNAPCGTPSFETTSTSPAWAKCTAACSIRLSPGIAAKLEIANSSCFILVKAMVEAGYLYEISDRNGYFPTGRIVEYAAAIDACDPIQELAAGPLRKLRDETEETISLGKLSGTNVLYVAVFESRKTLRVSSFPGRMIPMHAVAMGKALLSVLTPHARAMALGRPPLVRVSANTITDPAKLEANIKQCLRNGYFISESEASDHAMAIAWPLTLNESHHAVQLLGPCDRVKPVLPRLVKALRATVEEIEQAAQPRSAKKRAAG